MSTIRDIIIDAYREAAIIGTGETPDADQLDEALRRLNVLYDSLFGHDLGEPLTAINYGRGAMDNVFGQAEDQSSDISTTYFPANSRLILNLEAAATLYLAPNPRDGARIGILDNRGNLATYNLTLNANGRRIETTPSVTLSTDSLNREWFFRGDLGNWVRVIDLAIDDDSPLPSEFDDLLITLLAFRINPRHGAETSQEMLEVLKRMRRLFRARYKQSSEQDSEMGLYRLSSSKAYWKWDNFNG